MPVWRDGLVYFVYFVICVFYSNVYYVTVFLQKVVINVVNKRRKNKS